MSSFPVWGLSVDNFGCRRGIGTFNRGEIQHFPRGVCRKVLKDGTKRFEPCSYGEILKKLDVVVAVQLEVLFHLDRIQIQLERFEAFGVGIVVDGKSGLRQFVGLELLDVSEAGRDWGNAERRRDGTQILQQTDHGEDGVVLGSKQLTLHSLEKSADCFAFA